MFDAVGEIGEAALFCAEGAFLFDRVVFTVDACF